MLRGVTVELYLAASRPEVTGLELGSLRRLTAVAGPRGKGAFQRGENGHPGPW